MCNKSFYFMQSMELSSCKEHLNNVVTRHLVAPGRLASSLQVFAIAQPLRTTGALNRSILIASGPRPSLDSRFLENRLPSTKMSMQGFVAGPARESMSVLGGCTAPELRFPRCHGEAYGIAVVRVFRTSRKRRRDMGDDECGLRAPCVVPVRFRSNRSIRMLLFLPAPW